MGFFHSADSRNTDASARESEYLRLREHMVREQLEGRDIKDARVLAAMLKIPRHRFVPDEISCSAYQDSPLPIMHSQTISQPYIVGYMTQMLQLQGQERVLEVGTGSGYQTAILAELALDVYTIEILPELAARARWTLHSLGYSNIHTQCSDGYSGWIEAAPFDRIIVTAAPEITPQPLIEQLAAGGRMVIPVGRSDQQLVVVEKGERGITQRLSIPVRFVPMTGVAAGHKGVTGDG